MVLSIIAAVFSIAHIVGTGLGLGLDASYSIYGRYSYSGINVGTIAYNLILCHATYVMHGLLISGSSWGLNALGKNHDPCGKPVLIIIDHF